MIAKYHWMILAAALMVGCGQTYPAISIDAAKEIKSGTPLAEIESLLGQSHTPTSKQLRQLDGVLSKMSPNVRRNAERDRAVAWGDESDFLVVRVNDKGIAWVIAWRSK